MRPSVAILAVCLLPASALAGAQYSAEDIIRYFEQANAGQPGRTAPVPGRGVVVGEPPAATGLGAGQAHGAGHGASTGLTAGETPLVIPMTGAKAGYTVASATSGPAQAGPSGYDLLVTFEIGSATLTPQARQNLDAFAVALGDPALSGLRFSVEGHTDATGPADSNQRLSEARAASVVAYLVSHGIQAARLVAAGHGETRPRLDDPTHPDNRRVEARRID